MDGRLSVVLGAQKIQGRRGEGGGQSNNKTTRYRERNTQNNAAEFFSSTHDLLLFYSTPSRDIELFFPSIHPLVDMVDSSTF